MTEVVELTIPVQANLVMLARLTAATMASRAGFDVEEIDDLRLAVDELCILAVGDSANGRLLISFETDMHQIEISCILLPAPDQAGSDFAGVASLELSLRILEALVDEHGDERLQGGRRLWLRKRRTRQEA